jgi:hypothetical protein
MPWPAFKVQTAPGSWAVVDYTGERTRPASVEEIEQLSFAQTVAPILVEDATRALLGVAPWIEDEYDELLPVPEVCTTAYVFSHSPPPAPPGYGEHVTNELLARHIQTASETGSTHSRFFLTVPSRRAWWRLRSGLKRLGLEGAARRDEAGSWTVTAEGPVNPGEVVDELESLARSAGGTYEGHEQAVV